MDEVDGMAGNEDRGGIQVSQVFLCHYFITLVYEMSLSLLHFYGSIYCRNMSVLLSVRLSSLYIVLEW